uniref:Uncharacterized protein n=1 Tax=Helianthus annuus TaxID=4232 RepID=A0A251STY5_HELAN
MNLDPVNFNYKLLQQTNKPTVHRKTTRVIHRCRNIQIKRQNHFLKRRRNNIFNITFINHHRRRTITIITIIHHRRNEHARPHSLRLRHAPWSANRLHRTTQTTTRRKLRNNNYILRLLSVTARVSYTGDRKIRLRFISTKVPSSGVVCTRRLLRRFERTEPNPSFFQRISDFCNELSPRSLPYASVPNSGRRFRSDGRLSCHFAVAHDGSGCTDVRRRKLGFQDG